MSRGVRSVKSTYRNRGAFLATILVVLLCALMYFQSGSAVPPLAHEAKFADSSLSGLSIVPASCPSSPHYAYECDPMCSISASPSTIAYGGGTTLSWWNRGFPDGYGGYGEWITAVGSINGVGSVGPSGSAAVYPGSSVTYTYSGTYYAFVQWYGYAYPVGSFSCSVGVNVSYNPASCSVSLSPSAVNRGNASTISWSSSNAHYSVYINNIGYVGSSGSTSVAPTATTDYSCYAYGYGGSAGWSPAALTVYQPCSWSGGSVANGSSVTAYQSSSVPFGTSCQSQTRTCSNGTLSGSYAHVSCSVAPPANCSLGGQTVQHGSSHTFYTQSTAPLGQLCSAISQSRSCYNGTLSGSNAYTYSSCVCAPQYYCSGSQTIMHRNAACASSTVSTCGNPGYCVAGNPVCVYPNMTVATDGELTARPSVVPSGTTARLYWEITDAQSCTLTGTNGDSWSVSGNGTSGRQTSGITERTTYTLTCQGYPNTIPATITQTEVVNNLPIFQEI